MKCVDTAWKAHEAELLRFIAARLPDREEARDLLQEVFLRALRQPDALCGVENPRAWLFQVARNLLIDRFRLQRQQLPLDEDWPAAEIPEVPPVDRLADCLPRVLGELAEADREAIRLCDIEGLSQQEFAQHQGLSLAAAKSRVQRARRRLRARLVQACQVRFDGEGQVCCFVPRPPLLPRD